MEEYKERIIGAKLEEYLRHFGAVSLEGPLGCGKTTLRTGLAESTVNLSSPDTLALAELSDDFIFEGDRPIFIDEWQRLPQLWDRVSSEMDGRGNFILASSARAGHPDDKRIGELSMRTMSLFETGDSSGDVSIQSLFAGDEVHGQLRSMRLSELIHYIIRGGWPGNMNGEDPARFVGEYLTALLDSAECRNVDRARLKSFLTSLAKAESTSASALRLAKNAQRPLDNETAAGYLRLLDHLYISQDQEAFAPPFPCRTRLKSVPKRHLADPSLAASLAGADEKSLLGDLEYLGRLFEALAVHDLTVYMDALGGKVFHYQDYNGDEVDAVLQLPDGAFGLVETKPGYGSVVETAAKSLAKVAAKLGQKPAFMAVVSGMAPAPLRRPDGIYVLPLTSLRP